MKNVEGASIDPESVSAGDSTMQIAESETETVVAAGPPAPEEPPVDEAPTQPVKTVKSGKKSKKSKKKGR